MKITKKVLSLILAISMLLGTVTFAATYKDVAQTTKYYSAVSLLSALDIIKGYEDGTFGPDKNVTRAEFSVMLVRTLGLSGVGNSDPAGLTFKDLGTVAWAVSDIRTAYDLGIINGMSSEEFAPDSQVTYEQAIKMIVCALGYKIAALDRVGGDENLVYPDGYLAVATQNNIDTGVSVNKGQPAKRWEIAKLLYNSLEIDLMEKVLVSGSDQYKIRKGKTILSEKLRIKTGTGELKADEATSVSANGQLSKTGEATIYQQDTSTEETYLKGTIATTGIVGHSIKYYYREDNNGIKTLTYLEDKTNSSAVLKIDANNIDDIAVNADGSVKISYWVNKDTDRNTTDVTLAAGYTSVINGRTATTVSPETDFMPLSGDIELMSTSSNGTYDKIFVSAYETYVVKGINSIENTVADQYRSGTVSIDVNSNDYTLTMVRTDKSATTLSNLVAWNVLSVKKTSSSGKNTMEVIVSNNSVTGSITELDKDNGKIKVGTTNYEFSNYFKKYNSLGINGMTIDDSGKFYLDKDGKIAAFDKAQSRGNNYGYLVKADVDSSGVAAFKLLLQTSTTMGGTTSGASKVKINGEVASDDAIKALPAQLVKYSLNSSNKIDGITTKDAPATSGITLKPSVAEAIYKYNSSSRQFFKVTTTGSVDTVSTTPEFRVDTSTFVFVIPTNLSAYDSYSKQSYGYLKNNSKYTLEAYDIDSTDSMKVAKAVVLYGEDSSTKISDETPIAIITKITDATNKDGVTVKKVTAYYYGKDDSGTQKDILTQSSSTLNGISVGDVIRYGTTADGYIKDNVVGEADSVKVLFNVHDGTQGTTDVSSDGGERPLYSVTPGFLYSVGERVGAVQSFDVALTKADLDDTASVKKSFTTDGTTVFFVYDGTAASATKLSSSTNNLDLKTINYYMDATATTKKASQIFVYSLYGVVKVIYYYIPKV